jgi:carbamoyl-phosphate synthase small subunit
MWCIDFSCWCLTPLPVGGAAQVSLINLNDGTCAGMVHPGLRAMSVQSHPEASPGPHDSDVAFMQVGGWPQPAAALAAVGFWVDKP